MTDLEIVDSGQDVTTADSDPGQFTFWAVVENDSQEREIDLRLELLEEKEVLIGYEQSKRVGVNRGERFEYVVPVPKEVDQYRFSITDVRSEGHDG